MIRSSIPRRPKEKPLVGASFLTAYPDFQRGSMVRSILSAQLTRGGIYVPEFVELGKADNYHKVPFEPQFSDSLEKKWEASPQPGLSLERYHPQQVYTYMSSKQDWLPFSHVMIHVQRDYFNAQARVDGFLDLLRGFYDSLHPAYGEVLLQEMVKKYDHPVFGNITPGVDLERALPNIYWALFLGPEYVEMFGQENVLAAPTNRVERLRDGGALLRVSPSPLDYLTNPSSFEEAQTSLKSHLGESAFSAWPERQGRVPRFRWVEEKRRWGNWMFRRSHWESWVRGNRFHSLNLRGWVSDRNIRLNFSEKSLRSLDEYISQMRIKNREESYPPSYGTVTVLAAYVSQVILKHLGGHWSFDEWDEVPILVVNGQRASPLEKTLRALQRGESFDSWYHFLKENQEQKNPN